MKDYSILTENLKAHGFAVSCFETKEEANSYLAEKLKGKEIGIGGSLTVEQMGLYDVLAKESKVLWHWKDATREEAAAAPVYITSANGVAKTGEIINIDGGGNRVASTIFGHEAVYFVIGSNKIADDYDKALWRARNIASPKNAKRLNMKTPCAVKGDKCYNCNSPDRICKVLSVHWCKPNSIPYAEVVIIDEELGY